MWLQATYDSAKIRREIFENEFLVNFLTFDGWVEFCRKFLERFFLFSADVPHLGVYDGAKYDLGGRNGWARFGGRETGTTEDFAFSQ